MPDIKPEALEAARKKCPGSFLTDDRLEEAIQAAIAAADLVPRSELDKLVPSWALIKLGEAQKKYEKLRDAKFKDATTIMAPIVLERDEARAQVIELQALIVKANSVLEPYIEMIKRIEEQEERQAMLDAAPKAGEPEGE